MGAACHLHDRMESLVVVRALVGQDVAGGRDGLPCGQFLKAGLVVLDAGVDGGQDEPITEQSPDERSRCLRTTIQVDRSDDRLEGVGQNGLLVAPTGRQLPVPEADRITQPDNPGHLGERRSTHDRGADHGQVPLRKARVVPEKLVGYHHSQHGVAQELQPLVGRAAILRAPRTVSRRIPQQARVSEPVAEAGLQADQVVGLLLSRGERRHSRRHRGPS